MVAALKTGVALLDLGSWHISGRDTVLPLGPSEAQTDPHLQGAEDGTQASVWAAESNALPGVTSHPSSPKRGVF